MNATYRVTQCLIFLAGIGMLTYCWRTGVTLNFSDEKQYLTVAQNVANGSGYVLDGAPTAYRPPVWPLALAPILAVGLPMTVVSLIPGIFLLLAAWAAAKIGVHLSGSRLGIIAALGVLLYPLNIYTAGTLYPQAIATALLLGLWLIVAKIADGERRPATYFEALAAGLLGAALALSVPTLAFTAVAALAWLVYRQIGDRLRVAMMLVIGFAGPIVAWTVRNWFALGSPVPLSTSTGINLLLGNNANTTPSNGLAADVANYRETATTLNLDELGRNRFFTEQALEWIRDHPIDAIALYIGKLANFFAPYNAPATEGQGGSTEKLVSWICAILITFAVAYRYHLSRTGRLNFQRSEILFIVIFFANAPVMAIFFTRVRFRQPLDSIFLVEASLAATLLLVTIIKRHSKRERKRKIADIPNNFR